MVFTVDPAWTDRWWYALGDSADGATLRASLYGVEFLIAPFAVHVNFDRPQTVLGDSCDPADTAANELIGPDPQDFVQWLQKNQWLATSNLQQVVVSGWRGLSIDAVVKPDQSICATPAGTVRKLYLYRTSASGPEAMTTDETARFVVLDVGGSSPLLIWSDAQTRYWERTAPWAQQLIDTLRPYQQSSP